MTETPSIYKPHKPTRKIGDPFPRCVRTVSGDDIVSTPHSSDYKAVIVVRDSRTQSEATMTYYFGDRVDPARWEQDATCTIEQTLNPLGYELVEIKYLAEVTIDFNTKSLFEAVPEEDRVVYKDELTTE